MESLFLSMAVTTGILGLILAAYKRISHKESESINGALFILIGASGTYLMVWLISLV